MKPTEELFHQAIQRAPARNYTWAIKDFWKWNAEQPLNRSTIESYIANCQKRELQPASISLALSAIRLVCYTAYEQNLLSGDELISIRAVQGNRPRLRGLFLSRAVIQELIDTPDHRTLIGKRDRAAMAVCFSGPKPSRVASLTVTQFPTIHSDAQPYVQAWLDAAGITSGVIFRRMMKGGKVIDANLNREGLWNIFRKHSAAIGEHITPQDAHRTFQKQMKPQPRRILP